MRRWVSLPRTFDETYYAKVARSLLRFDYEGNWPDRRIADPPSMRHHLDR